MTIEPVPDQPLFDAYAAHYDAALNQGIAVSGESKEFFAEQRVLWLARRLRSRGFVPRSILDFGCGIGTGLPFFWREFRPECLAGFDVSTEALAVAGKLRPSVPVALSDRMDSWPDATFDLVSTNGVFHHIAPEARQTALEAVRRVLRPGGCFALWENNPWNPGARYVMYRIPFDRDAVLVYPSTARRMLQAAGFDSPAPDFRFVFPRALSFLRWIEPALVRWPIGAQYLQLGWKP
jgi:SAM-dependent methyltransferase